MYKLKNIENYPNAKTNNKGLKKLDNTIEALCIVIGVSLVISLISLLIFIIALIAHSQNEILLTITVVSSSIVFITGALLVHLSDIENEIFINTEDYDIVLKEIEDEKYKEFFKQYTRLKEELEQEQEQEQED